MKMALFALPLPTKTVLRPKRGLNLVYDLFHQDYDLIILDEINSTVALDMLNETEVCAMMQAKPANLELVMTGRNVPASMLELADLVTEMTPIKHYFNKGVPARRGIEF
jgi:cob(I)alamin adenosyltransferase